MATREQKLAQILVEHSVNVTKGSNVVIDMSDFTAKDLALECYKLCIKKGANVYLDVFGTNYQIGRADLGGFYNEFIKLSSKNQLTTSPKVMEAKIDWGDKFIRIVSIHNRNFLSRVNQDNIGLWRKTYYPTFEKMINKDWVLTYFPTAGTAQNAKMSLEEFTDYYYKACIVDYKAQSKQIKKVQDILDKGKVVRIVAKDTDLTLGINGRLAAGADTGKHNVPDGECFIGPEEDKTNGYITFEYPQNYDGSEVDGVRFEFKNGEIVNYTASQNKKFLDKIFSEDPCNRRLGELGIGMNPMIKNYIKDILFDEKIYGTIHLAIGKSYDYVRGGGKNKGSVHWDMIKDLRHKGSVVTVDGVVLIRDGKFLI
ncbi:MAG: hypothetical protein ACD_22C00030G0003 [uncultured bacterium]|nr:MAG: hypothetical protein ACD_22C00030G0003 [uncultured bacterium]